jgi:hypothetical protein
METPENEVFRDSIATISEEGKRNWIFPKKPSGPFYDKRKIVSYILLAFLFAAPFIKVNGNQFLMFNVLERRFNIFGFPFWPQDFHLFRYLHDYWCGVHYSLHRWFWPHLLWLDLSANYFYGNGF